MTRHLCLHEFDVVVWDDISDMKETGGYNKLAKTYVVVLLRRILPLARGLWDLYDEFIVAWS
jgi:hypothetical protein